MLASTIIATDLQSPWLSAPSVAAFDTLSIDSRSLQNGVNTLFFALPGKQHDGHAYIPELIEKGVCHFVVSKLPENVAQHVHFILVENVLVALQKLAAAHRSRFSIPVIGITGSNGKTIVKEWLYHLLSPEYSITKSPKSYNSQVGVPLSVLALNNQTTLGLFEAGISTTHEMEVLQQIIQPTIGVLTHIGSAHNEGFDSLAQKITEKVKLFTHAKTLIYKQDLLHGMPLHQNLRGYSWSYSQPSADVIVQKKVQINATDLEFKTASNLYNFRIPFTDEASIENAINCAIVLVYLGYDNEQIAKRMATLFPVEMRLKVKAGLHNCTLIDDSYSADLDSLKIALDFLEHHKKHPHKTVILSDVFQSGLSEEALYNQVAELTKIHKINRVFGIGSAICRQASRLVNWQLYPTTEAFLAELDQMQIGNETILIKGARVFEFEQLVSALEEKTHETVLEINLNALAHNLNYYRSKLAPGTKLMVMVKAFGYGNGGTEIAKLLAHHKINYLGVAFTDEGIALKNAGIDVPIMVMNPESSSYATIIQHRLEPELYSIKGLRAFVKMAELHQLNRFPIHLKLDTGMHRLGFDADQLPEMIAILQATKSVHVKSILSHLATSDDLANKDFAQQQIAEFKTRSEQLQQALGYRAICHLANSSAISNYPDAQFDMVRLGIGLYGISNNPAEQPALEQVGTLKSVISQIRTIQAGESVGYGRRFVADKPLKIATIPVGYADGISRRWGNELGYVSIHGKPAPIVGSICMDMLMVNVTGIDCEEGDRVQLFGDSPTVVEMAQKLHTIPYEIITGISQRVKRIFYRE
ncbi:MAG: bifunctional UDP-N-acetylmuramoyl-tripeptide:D-alanyl-D-alanine ligase/alanine racemase [Flavobacterium sp.]|nr:bifunctional UDP-N-acetylmuramoyl-tripeptide:D-alanyl-D-alanine ligase/alanine racemase [Flavobacterium sp.]